MGWSMEGVQGVVHGRGPRGGPWTGGQYFQLSPEKTLFFKNQNNEILWIKKKS